MLQASLGRSGKQPQEQNSPNLAEAFLLSNVKSKSIQFTNLRAEIKELELSADVGGEDLVVLDEGDVGDGAAVRPGEPPGDLAAADADDGHGAVLAGRGRVAGEAGEAVARVPAERLM